MNASIINDRVRWIFESEELKSAEVKPPARKSRPDRPDEPPAEVLVPMDFSACSFRALQTAVRFARKHGAGITLLHVLDANLVPTYRVDVVRIEREIMSETEKNFRQIIEPLSASVRIATKIAKGRPFEQIVKVARQKGVKLIIMGKNQPGSFWKLFRRHTVERVIKQADCEVIAVESRAS